MKFFALISLFSVALAAPQLATPTPSGPQEPATNFHHRFDFLFNYERIMESTNSTIDQIDHQVKYLTDTNNFFSTLVKDEGDKIKDLRNKVVKEHFQNLDKDEMFDRLIPDLVKSIYRAHKFFESSVDGENGKHLGRLLTKIDDILERSYRDMGKLESNNGKVSSRFFEAVKALKVTKKEIQEDLKTNNMTNGKLHLSKIYQQEDILKDEMLNYEAVTEAYFY